MKNLNILSILGIFSLVFGLFALWKSYPEPPARESLQGVRAILVSAQPGPVAFPGPRKAYVLGTRPGAWVLVIAIDGAEKSFEVDAPGEDRLRLLRSLERNTPIKALVHGGRVWQLEQDGGGVLLDYESRVAIARANIEGDSRVEVVFFAVGLALIAAGWGMRWVMHKSSDTGRNDATYGEQRVK
jgi:hypothetical protein